MLTFAEVKEFIRRYGESPSREDPEQTLWRLFHEMNMIEGVEDAETFKKDQGHVRTLDV